MSNLNLLYMEDDIDVKENVVYFLERYFNCIYVATDGEEAYKIYLEKNIDILLLDMNVPKMNGIALSKKIREDNKKIPIIFLSAYSDRDRLLEVLKLGVSSYIVKPFILQELTNTIKDSIKIVVEEQNIIDEVYFGEELLWKSSSKSLIYMKLPIYLSQKEILLTELFVNNKNKVFTLEEILEELFGDTDMELNSITQLISRFKRKIVSITKDSNFFIENIYKQGYKLR